MKRNWIPSEMNSHLMQATTILIIAILFFGYNSDRRNNEPAKENLQLVSSKEKPDEINKIYLAEFNRDATYDRLKNKVKNNEPLVVHLRIPLCDNENQGIVPVPKALGNGFDLKSNLYWGAKYGFKNFFHRYTDWRLISSEKDQSDEILERVIFRKSMENGADVFIVADAYKGNKMKECLTDYLNSVAGRKDGYIDIGGNRIGINSHADLLIFNGHNGLMDNHLELVPSKDQIPRETSVIGCISHSYFKGHLLAANGYPVLMTTNLLAPEAYVLESVIESWAELKTEEEIRSSAGAAYHKYQKCGIEGATELFKYGW